MFADYINKFLHLSGKTTDKLQFHNFLQKKKKHFYTLCKTRRTVVHLFHSFLVLSYLPKINIIIYLSTSVKPSVISAKNISTPSNIEIRKKQTAQ